VRNSSTKQQFLFSLALLIFIFSGSRLAALCQKPLSEAVPIVEPDVIFEHTDRVDTVVFHPNSRMLVSESFHDGIKLSDAFKGGLLRNLQTHGFSANSISYSHSGDTLAIGCNDGKVRVLDGLTLDMTMTLPVTKWGIQALAFSNDDQTLACDAADGTVQLWNLNTGKAIRNLGTLDKERVIGIAFSPDDKVVAAVTRNGRVNVWEISTGKLLGTLPEYSHIPQTIGFCNDGKTVAIGNWGGIRLWDYRESPAERRVEIPDSIRPAEPVPNARGEIPPGGGLRPPRETFLSGDCETAATVMEGGNIAVWSVRTRALQQRLNANSLDLRGVSGIISVSFSSDGNLLASGNFNGKVALWRLR
jgi:WD40 repeat protein